MHRYWIEPDADGEPAVWENVGNPLGPDPVARRYEVSPAAWALLCRAVTELEDA